MTRAAVIGENVRVCGYALAGAEVHAAEDDAAARTAWEALPADVACLILTPAAHAALGELLPKRPELVWAILPR